MSGETLRLSVFGFNVTYHDAGYKVFTAETPRKYSNQVVTTTLLSIVNSIHQL